VSRDCAVRANIFLTCSSPPTILFIFRSHEFLEYWLIFPTTGIIANIPNTFSILQQSLSLGCFPRVKVVHTSAKYQGQVYVPEANYLLMLACVGITLGFRTTTNIGNAYGNIPKSTYSFSLYY
jgi:K+ transporter